MPSSFEVRVAAGGPAFVVRDGERILAAARRAGVWLPFECGWGSCATCKVTLVEGEVELLFPGAPAVTDRDARRRRVLVCQTTPRSDLVIKPLTVGAEPGAERPTADHLATLVGVEDLGPQIRRSTFRLDRPGRFREGQYAVVDLGPGLRRCYSMANRPGSPNVEFVTKAYRGGAGSERLHGLRIGDTAGMELPYGDMWLRDADRPVVLIAGGTGLSPILALARQLAAAADSRPVRVFYGAGSRPELVCVDELAALAGGLPDGRLHVALERPTGPSAAAATWDGTTGYVTDAIDRHLDGPADRATCYLAGPPPMVDAVLACLRRRDVPLSQIHYDRFG